MSTGFFLFRFPQCADKIMQRKITKKNGIRGVEGKNGVITINVVSGVRHQKILCSSSILEFFCFVYSNFNWWKCQKANISILFIHEIQTRMYFRPIFLNLLSFFLPLNVRCETNWAELFQYSLFNIIFANKLIQSLERHKTIFDEMKNTESKTVYVSNAFVV